MATSWRSAKLNRSTRRSGSGAKSSWASCSVASCRIRARSISRRPNTRRSGGSPSVRFSAIDSAGTSRSSCGMATMPAAMASRGPSNRHALPSTAISPRSGRCTPPRMRTSVDLPAPFSPTSACTSPASTSKSTPSSARVAPKCLDTPRALPAGLVMPVASRRQRATRATRIFSSAKRPRSMITSLSSVTVQSRIGTS